MSIQKFEFGEFPDGKTNYQIINEFKDKTTITLDKWVADILQIELQEKVHERIQLLYNNICENHPQLGRKAKGNLIRDAAIRRANEYQKTKKDILGWNDEELLMSL